MTFNGEEFLKTVDFHLDIKATGSVLLEDEIGKIRYRFYARVRASRLTSLLGDRTDAVPRQIYYTRAGINNSLRFYKRRINFIANLQMFIY